VKREEEMRCKQGLESTRQKIRLRSNNLGRKREEEAITGPLMMEREENRHLFCRRVWENQRIPEEKEEPFISRTSRGKHGVLLGLKIKGGGI